MPGRRPFLVSAVSALVALALLGALPRAARAEISFVSTGDETTPDVRYSWYGYQGLGLDATAALVLAGGIFESPVQKPLLLVGVGLFAVGAPLVHHAHGNVGRALVSLTLRTALPLAAGLASYESKGCAQRSVQCDGGDDLAPFVIGGLAAIGVALVDDVLLGWESHDLPRPTRWAPSAAPSAGGLTFGVVGTF